MTQSKSIVVALALGLFAVIAGMFPASTFAHSNSDNPSIPKVEVAITDGGKVLVRGAKVTSVSGSTINAQATWGSLVLNWSIATNGDTVYYDAHGKKTGTFSSIATGDTVSFAGNLTGLGSTMSVTATAVKDWSPIPGTSTSGEVKSINASSNSLVLEKNKNKSITVQFNSSTTITVNGTTTPFSGLAVGDHLKVTGVFNTEGTVITATNVVATKKISSGDKRFNGIIKNWFNDKKFGGFFKNGND